MVHQPLISLVVPILNTRTYIAQCLSSLVSQTLQPVEVICVDNGSTDGSFEFLVDCVEKHDNMIVIRHTEGRQGGARNAGIEIARGRYIGFVDSDDFVSPYMFAKMYAAAATQAAEVVVCNMELFYSDGTPNRQAMASGLLDHKTAATVRERPELLRNLTICNKLFSRALIDRLSLRFPAGCFHEDQFFVIVALLLANRVATLSEPLYFYRRGRFGSVNEGRGADCMHIFPVMQRVLDFAKDQGLDSELSELIDEVRALKYLQVYRLAGRQHRKPYYQRMQKEFRSMKLGSERRILSQSEFRECEVVRRFPPACYDLYLFLKSRYGVLRSRVVAKGSPKSGVVDR